jgi:hypothetical protein
MASPVLEVLQEEQGRVGRRVEQEAQEEGEDSRQLIEVERA